MRCQTSSASSALFLSRARLRVRVRLRLETAGRPAAVLVSNWHWQWHRLSLTWMLVWVVFASANLFLVNKGIYTVQSVYCLYVYIIQVHTHSHTHTHTHKHTHTYCIYIYIYIVRKPLPSAGSRLERNAHRAGHSAPRQTPLLIRWYPSRSLFLPTEFNININADCISLVTFTGIVSRNNIEANLHVLKPRGWEIYSCRIFCTCDEMELAVVHQFLLVMKIKIIINNWTRSLNCLRLCSRPFSLLFDGQKGGTIIEPMLLV